MDEELRKLEREFQQSGDPQSEARLLRKQLQLNMLSEWQLQVAAWMGYPPARSIIPVADSDLMCVGANEHPDDFADKIAHPPAHPGEETKLIFAMTLSMAKEIVDRLQERDADDQLYDSVRNDDTRRRHILHVINRGLAAAVKSFAYLDLEDEGTLESPDLFGFDGQIYHELSAEVQRSELYFALFCIYNLCEALTANALNADHERSSHISLTFHNALEFFAFEREWLCEQIGRTIVPWVLQPGELMATDFVARYFMSRGLR